MCKIDVIDYRDGEVEDVYEDSFSLAFFIKLKEQNAFNENKEVKVLLPVELYYKAQNWSSFMPQPARLQFGDYSVLIDC